MAIRTVAISFLLAVMTCAAGAHDAIKSGNWEYSVTASGVTQLPPGMEPSSDTRLGPEGLTFVKTRCITAADPFPPMHDSGEVCKMDKTDVNGGTLRWSVTCVTPKITVHQDWVIHYHGETMDGEFTLRGNMPNRPPIERTQQLTGRYLSPCDAK